MLGEAREGGSVGNPIYQTRVEYDFRIGYPEKWMLTASQGNDMWVIANNPIDPAKVSKLTLNFQTDPKFENEQSLEKYLRTTYPQEKWERHDSGDFVDFVSAQQIVGPGRTRNYEFFFVERNKIIGIEAYRDQEGGGAREVDQILDTIQRPSGVPRLKSITLKGGTQNAAKVGDTVCYRLGVKTLRPDIDKNSVSTFEIHGLSPFWSFKTIKWEPRDSAFHVCVKVTERFARDGLLISRIILRSSPGKAEECAPRPSDPGDPGKPNVLICTINGAEKHDISYRIAEVQNPSPAMQAPSIESVVSHKLNSISIRVRSALPLQIGHLSLKSGQGLSLATSELIIYPDQMRAGQIEIKLDPKRYPSGWATLQDLSLVDKVGQAVILRREEKNDKYKLFSSSSQPVQSEIEVVSVQVGEK
jgi:hypothetical protein